jgi:hypothetical protein
MVPQDAPIKLLCGLAAPSGHRSVVAGLGPLQLNTGPIFMLNGAAEGGMGNSSEKMKTQKSSFKGQAIQT